MKVLVTFEARFVKDARGDYFARGPVTYDFLKRYLLVFEEVIVFARVKYDENPDYSQLRKANGENVTFFEVPYYQGLYQYIKKASLIDKVAASAAKLDNCAFVLRAPGRMSDVIEKHLIRKKKPYALEVVADPWDVLSPGSLKVVGRPLIRRLCRLQLAKQCRRASLVSYVTKESLQKRYPSTNWSTHYSSIELYPNDILDESVAIKRADRIKNKIDNKIPLRLCFAGSMETLYKAPDVLVEACEICLDEGTNIELVMIGDGKYMQLLKERISKKGRASKILFLGKLPPGEAVYQQMDLSDIYILPSRQEGLPRSVIEAMARGLPCIGSTVGGFPELLEPDELVEPGNAGILAKKIKDYVNNPKRLCQASLRNTRKALDYNSKILNERRCELYSKLRKLY